MRNAEFQTPSGLRAKLGIRPKSINIPVRNAGAEIKNGAILVLDLASMAASAADPVGGHDIYVTTSTTVGDKLTCGVARGTITAAAAGGKGFMCIEGACEVALKGASVNIARGDIITTGATAGYGYKADGVSGQRGIGFAIDATTADSTLGTDSSLKTVYVRSAYDFTMVGVTASAEELNFLDTSVAGTAVASKALVLGADKNIDTLAIADGGLKLGAGAGTAVTATAAQLNRTAVTTAGTAEASKVAVLGANKNLDTLVVADGGLYLGAGAGTQVNATAAELNTLDNSANTQAITEAVAITLSASQVNLTPPAGNGTYAVTLAAPTLAEAGQIKRITMTTTDGTGAVTLALTNVVGQSGGTGASFDAAGETLILLGSYGGATATRKWIVLKEIGVTLA